ncbi:MAG: helix-turn-helix domain-containing protein [Firmicutes bacterium]|nr:helix-turn-helix domain-containing protein [Bacillota bacterium]
MTISKKIFELLQEKGITQYKFAKDLGLTHGQVTDWKVGRSNPTVERLIKVADYFDVSVDYLLGRTENPKINL